VDIQILSCSHNYYPLYSSAKSTNHIYFMKPHHPNNHNHGFRYKSSRLFQLTPNSLRVLVRIKVTCTSDIWSQKLVEGINLKHDDGWLGQYWHVLKKVISQDLYFHITKELRMRSVWMWIDSRPRNPIAHQNEVDIQILFWSHNYYPIYCSAKSTNHIYFMKPHHPKNHNHGSRYKSSRLFQLTPNIQRVLVRMKVMCLPDICSQKLVEGITWNMMPGD